MSECDGKPLNGMAKFNRYQVAEICEKKIKSIQDKREEMMRDALFELGKWAAAFRLKFNTSWFHRYIVIGCWHKKAINSLNDDQLLRYHDSNFNDGCASSTRRAIINAKYYFGEDDLRLCKEILFSCRSPELNGGDVYLTTETWKKIN